MTAFADHNDIGSALGNDSGDQNQLMRSACTDSRVVEGQDFRVTGEWSMSSNVDWEDVEFFKNFFTAQQQLYEKPGMYNGSTGPGRPS
ncbi:hypothetical protein ED733_003579 [Metarhizium rileyi]|uniref:Uncharacterized protein n=1 Tax=Metarhizium rileyi (strain RCEF 4871) TaxID=1649241 RepID=A0A5C6G3S0_METRR|nr:hypothetical protein ED733_003579 [Metarhizium rileyi]